MARKAGARGIRWSKSEELRMWPRMEHGTNTDTLEYFASLPTTRQGWQSTFVA